MSVSQTNQHIYKHIYVLGNGQLARMLKQAAEPLCITVEAIGLECETDTDIFKKEFDKNAAITAEIERWPQTPITEFLSSQKTFVNHNIFGQLADRYTQKALLDRLHLSTAPWTLLPEVSQWENLFDSLGEKLVIKTRTGGYDGRGQWRVKRDEINNALPHDLAKQAIVESMIPFSYEVSLVGARSYNGDKVFYPITHNYHQAGILRASISFSEFDDADKAHTQSILQTKAESMLGALLDDLNYVGVLAMECFVVETNKGIELLINELAPRVHNSGHWTQNGATISQFELHIRAIAGLPLPKPITYQTSVMVNIIGTPLDYAWINDSLVNLHWYDKVPREGRKLGHLNISHHNKTLISEVLYKLKMSLPNEYEAGLNWLEQHLK